MVRPRRRCITVWLAASLLLLCSLARAAEREKELEGIKKRITKEKQEITKVRRKEGSVLQSLEKIETALEQRGAELKKVNSRLDHIIADRQKKEEEAKKIEASLQARRALLRKRAVALYKWRRGGSPFILLNGSLSVADLMQRRHYLELTLAYDQELIKSLSQESARHEALRQDLARRSREMDAQRQALVGIQESIRSEREKKKEILSSLRKEKDAHARVLKELEQAALRLQKMMDEISRRSSVAPLPGGVGFEAMRGKLDLPVRGKVTEGFGKTMHPEFSVELFRKGIEIQAPIGEEIRAVEAGRVVFSDRFAGYGRMIIIDHGQRYYSIYAHLSDLKKKTGDTVQKGEAIGSVGDSDSLAGAQLYFEIRKDGKPIDPLPWFRRH